MKTVKTSPSHILKKTKSGKYRLVKVKTIIPSESLNRLSIAQALSSRSIKDEIYVLSEQVNVLHEVHDSDSNLVITKLGSLRSYVEKCFLLVFFVLFIILLTSLF